LEKFFQTFFQTSPNFFQTLWKSPKTLEKNWKKMVISRFGPRDEEIGSFITVMPNCELAENDHLSPPLAQETERTVGRRTAGRSSGAGRRKD
jgi:hypothetical protein